MITARRTLTETKLDNTEAEKPNIIETKPTSFKAVSASFNLRNVAPTMAGMKIRNENLAALVGSNPNTRRKAIVVPEREMPGRIERP